jgi:hypothetical protein
MGLLDIFFSFDVLTADIRCVKYKSDNKFIKLVKLHNAYLHNAPSLVESVKLIQNMVTEAYAKS